MGEVQVARMGVGQPLGFAGGAPLVNELGGGRPLAIATASAHACGNSDSYGNAYRYADTEAVHKCAYAYACTSANRYAYPHVLALPVHGLPP